MKNIFLFAFIIFVFILFSLEKHKPGIKADNHDKGKF